MQNVISKINSVDIVTVDRNGEIFVPIKPICEAIGIDVESQRDKINSDEILSSTAVLSTAVAADGKEREMYCLPLRYVYGWLFTINPKNVAPEAREAVSATMSSTSISPAPCGAPSRPTTPKLNCCSRSIRLSPTRRRPRAADARPRKPSASSGQSVSTRSPACFEKNMTFM